MTYSLEADLLTGNVPVSQALDPSKFVSDAADEIDSQIGFLYETPIDVSDESAVSRPAKLLLKRISNYLASGRLLMAADAAGQRRELHKYAQSLVDEAQAALVKIRDGEIRLDGAVLVDEPDAVVTGPLIYNVDEESNVEAFYDRIALAPPSYITGGIW